MNNAICDDCQSVRACFHFGCRPVEIETRNGGASIDTAAAGATGFYHFPERVSNNAAGWLARLRAALRWLS